MKILWVEDEEPIHAIVLSCLRRKGLDGFEFQTDGDAALQRYRDHGPYDLVVTDLYHPGLDGLKISRAIRRKNPAEAIVAFTGGGPKLSMHKFQRLHIPVLIKSVADMTELVSVLKDAVGEKRKKRTRSHTNRQL